jgi:putative AdoMet-dependent methyltransferase
VTNADPSRFDRWAEIYDEHVESARGFPFLKYEYVIERAVALAGVSSGMRVLDLGTGTGNLAGRFASRGCAIWAIDFSKAMLAKAREKHPEVHFGLGDLRDDPPPGFPSRYDRIVSAYAFHHVDLSEKIRLLSRLVRERLNPGGWIVIADIAFESAAARDAAHERLRGAWDEDEFYWAADETRAALQDASLHVRYEQASPCAGVFVITPVA